MRLRAAVRNAAALRFAAAARYNSSVPELSRFLGIVIRMHFRDHLPPHFHAEYGEFEITVGIDRGIIQGRFPRRALTAVLEWFLVHRAELEENWERASQGLPLHPVEPLE